MIILDYKDRRPIYEQVIEKMEELMLLGVLKENEPLPSGKLVELCNEKLGWKKATTYMSVVVAVDGSE